MFLRPKQGVSEKKPLLNRVKFSELGDVYRFVAGVWVCVGEARNTAWITHHKFVKNKRYVEVYRWGKQ